MFCVKVLVWKTNFETRDKEESSKKLWPSTSSKPSHHPHMHDLSPSRRSHVIIQDGSCQDHVTSYQGQTTKGTSLHMNRSLGPRDIVTPPSTVINVGPRLFHQGNQLYQSHILSTKACHPESLPSQSRTVPLEPMTMTPELAGTLEHIVGQLDILTQVGMHISGGHTHAGRYAH